LFSSKAHETRFEVEATKTRKLIRRSDERWCSDYASQKKCEMSVSIRKADRRTPCKLLIIRLLILDHQNGHRIDSQRNLVLGEGTRGTRKIKRAHAHKM